MNLARYRKAVVAIVAALVQAANIGLVPEQYQPWVTVVVAAATAAGVYGVPNETPPKPRKAAKKTTKAV